MKESISYKNSKQAGYLYLLTNLAAICLIIWVYVTGKYNEIILLFSLFPIIFLIKWLRKLLDNDDQLTIGNSGITIKEYGYFPWETIQSAEIISTQGKNATTELILILKNPDEEENSTYTFDCIPLSVKEEELKNSLDQYRNITSIDDAPKGIYKTRNKRPAKNRYGLTSADSKRNILKIAISITGSIAILIQIGLFRKTFIDQSTIIYIVLIGAILAALLDYKGIKKSYALLGFYKMLVQAILFSVFWGFILSCLFLFVNFQLRDKATSTTETFEILDYASKSGSKRKRSEREPVVTISYNQISKALTFSHDFYPTFTMYDEVELTIAKGYFNYDVIESKAFAGEPDESLNSATGQTVFILQCVINDVSTNEYLPGSFVVVSVQDSRDTLIYAGDTLQFELDYDKAYFLEYGKIGYDSKSMDFNTQVISAEMKELSSILPMTVSLSKTEGEYKNAIVADWHFDPKTEEFIWYRD